MITLDAECFSRTSGRLAVQSLQMPDYPGESSSTQPKLDELISLSEAAEISGFTTRHLRYLATSGELWAKKLGHNWFTTAQAVRKYMARDRRPGRAVRSHRVRAEAQLRHPRHFPDATSPNQN